MVKDKVNLRGLGPRNVLTRQTVQGRANDGGLRIGEMERDGVIGHGMSSFLKESFTVRGDRYAVAICNQTGSIAIFNAKENRFYSPMLEGPVKLIEPINEQSVITNINQHGLSFSIIHIPYCLKLLIQELQTMNIGLKLITEDNINQLHDMNYKILSPSSQTPSNKLNQSLTAIEDHMEKDVYMRNNRKFQDDDTIETMSTANPDTNDDESAYHLPSDDDDSVYHIQSDDENTPPFAPESGDVDSEVPFAGMSISAPDTPPLAPESDDLNDIVQDISEYNMDENDTTEGGEDDVITIKTDQIGDVIESSKFDSILQPSKLKPEEDKEMQSSTDHVDDEQNNEEDKKQIVL